MDNMIQQIVEADKKAQALVDQAQAHKQNAAEEMMAKRRKLAKSAMARANAEIEEKTKAIRLEAEAKWAAKEKSYDGVLAKLNIDYQTNKEQWVSKIVSMVLGKHSQST